jgi:hypothetical protein
MRNALATSSPAQTAFSTYSSQQQPIDNVGPQVLPSRLGPIAHASDINPERHEYRQSRETTRKECKTCPDFHSVDQKTITI